MIVASGGESLWVEVDGKGDGPVVVLTHGLGGNHVVWWQQVPALVAGGCRVVTWDQRGFGRSTRNGDFGPGPATTDLLNILDALRLDCVHLVGQSMGGWAAMGFALLHPDRLAGLVLTDTFAGVWNDEMAEAQRAAPPRIGPGHPALSPRFCADHPDRALLYERMSAFGNKPPDDEMLTLLRRTLYGLDAVRSMAVRTLLVCGAEDQLCPPSAMAAMASLLPNAELVVIDRAGHSPYYERPDEWNRAVLGFVTAA